MVEAATPEEAATILSTLPAPVTLLWHLLGKRRFRRYITSVRGGACSEEPRDADGPGGRGLLPGARPGLRAARRIRRVVLHATARCGPSSASPPTAAGPSSAGELPSSVALLLGFMAVCVAEVVADVLLWRAAPAAPRLAVALLPVELVFWIGFALPFGSLLGLARTALLVTALLVTALLVTALLVTALLVTAAAAADRAPPDRLAGCQRP